MKVIPFGDLFEFIRNGMNIKQDRSKNGLPITRIETIAAGEIDPERVGYAGLKPDDCERWFLGIGDILFSHINSAELVGKCAIYRGQPAQLVHGMNLLCLRPRPSELDSNYAQWLIRSAGFRAVLSNYINKAVNQASVSIGNLRTIQVSVPPLKEQRRIAAILDKAHSLRQKRRAALRTLDSLNQSIFEELERDGGLEFLTISDLIDSKYLLVHKDGNHGSQYPTADDFDHEGVAFLSVKAIGSDGEVINSEVDYLKEKKAILLKIGWIENGDVLLAHNASVGRVGVYRGQYGKALIGTSLTCFRPNKSKLITSFLAASLRSSRFQNELHKNMSQTTRNQVPITAQRRLAIPIAPLELQSKFAERMSMIDRLREKIKNAAMASNDMFGSLQSKAFRGEL